MVSQSEHVDTPPWLDTHCIGGHPALDFVNTVSHRIHKADALDRFDSIEKISSWLVFQSLLNDQQSITLQDSLIKQRDKLEFVRSISKVRKQAGLIFDSIAENKQIPADMMAQVLSVSSHSAIQIDKIAKLPDQASVFSLPSINAKSIRALFGLMIIDGVFRLPANRIHACPRCGWLFYDRSKGGRRKWCDMKACGNREKVAKHYLRQRQ